MKSVITSTVSLTLAIFPLLGFAGDIPAAQAGQLDPKRTDQLALQLFLDEENFGPGRVDGRWGEFTEKALVRWNDAHPDRKVELENGEPQPGRGMELWGNRPVLTEYALKETDFDAIGSLPEEPERKAQLESLPYAGSLEMISEKFRADHDLVEELNPAVNWESLKAGDTVTVPNVAEPFSLSAIKSIEAEQEKAPDSAAERSVHVFLGKRVVEVREGKELIASFPITVGERGNETPAGDWKVDVVQWMPEFRYDEKMLQEGVRSDNAVMLPPGPNNPVGIVWIGLNADGIGLHGTDNPHDIGRNSSSGCIRLSNWDAATLGRMLAVNTAVAVTR